MYMLRYPDELRNIEEVPQGRFKPAIDEAQLKLANVLVETMTKSFKGSGAQRQIFWIINGNNPGKDCRKRNHSVKEEETPIVDVMTALKEKYQSGKS